MAIRFFLFFYKGHFNLVKVSKGKNGATENEKVLRLVLPPTPPLTLVLAFALVLALVLALVFVEENVLKCR